MGSSSKGVRVKKEEEKDTTLASSGQQGVQKRKKKDISKVKCVNCGDLGHYSSQFPRKKGKGETSNSMSTPAKVEKDVETNDDCSMSAHAPLEKRWGYIELYSRGLHAGAG